MKDSLEALEIIKERLFLKEEDYVKTFVPCFLKISKDLERLETLEEENAKLKQAIKILKNKNVNIKLLRISKSVDSYNCFVSGINFYKNLTQEEFELLKEVFGNE